MAKVNFGSLKLKLKDEVKTITINEKEIEVKQYLSSTDKNAILEIAMQKAGDGTILNTYSLDVLFHLYIVFKYTNLSFTDNQKEDLFKLYDILESNGVINEVISAIPKEEYNVLRDNLLDMVDLYNDYRNSARALVEQLSGFAPNNAEKLNAEIEKFDVDKIEYISKLAAAAGKDN